ncbi:MAG: exo-alpha-sialidase [Flavobacteriales bacterium]|nr:hypothetical protein [Flavobacteriales bacterium]MCC6578413.1 exo-alpha-sialidase [Flavobacteriales bacterium]NUQ15912.1 exo-alpha-sialidase [Flavobacteriales bacterium]
MGRLQHLLVFLGFGCTVPLLAQWQQVGPVGSAYGIAVQGNAVYAGIMNGGLYRSSDHGATWTLSDTGITVPSIWWLSSIEGVLFCGTQGGVAFRSTDDGATWENIGLNSARGFALHNDTLYACQWYGASVHWSADMGATWQQAAIIPGGSGGLWPLLSHQGRLYVGGQTGGIYGTTASATPWATHNNGLNGHEAYAFTSMGNVLFAGMGDGVFRSDDGGLNWTASGLQDTLIYALHAHDSLLLAGCGYHGVMRSLDSGATWTPFNEGLTTFGVNRLTSDASHLYVGSLGGGVFRRPLVELTAVPEAGAWPFQVVVAPNPLRQVTEFRLVLDGAVDVCIELTDLAGARIAMLHPGRLSAGHHAVRWQADNVSPGTYLWKAVAGHIRQSGKLVVLD